MGDGNSLRPLGPTPPTGGTCHDEASCLSIASEPCHAEFLELSCHFPNLCAGLCDWVHLSEYCVNAGHRTAATIQQCILRVGKLSLELGEQHWFRANFHKPPVDWCPNASSMIGSNILS